MIDSHCHLDDPAFDPDRDQVVARANAAGVTGFVVPGVHPDRFAAQLAACEGVPGAVAVPGLHPTEADSLPGAELTAAIDALGAHLASAPALGEIGLDRRSWSVPGNRDRQLDAARAQLALARDLDLPIIVHCVRAHGLMLELLGEVPVPRGGIMHAYSGPADLVGDYHALGFCFGFGNTAGRSDKAVRALTSVRVHRIVLETDAPYMAASRAERNEPRAVLDALATVAKIRGEAPDELASRSDDAVRRLLRLD